MHYLKLIDAWQNLVLTDEISDCQNLGSWCMHSKNSNAKTIFTEKVHSYRKHEKLLIFFRLLKNIDQV